LILSNLKRQRKSQKINQKHLPKTMLLKEKEKGLASQEQLVKVIKTEHQG